MHTTPQLPWFTGAELLQDNGWQSINVSKFLQSFDSLTGPTRLMWTVLNWGAIAELVVH